MPGLPTCTRTAWGRSSISSRTTWASASRSINGGWTFSKTAPVPSTRRISTSNGSRSNPICRTRSCSRSWAINTDASWSAANCRCTSTRAPFSPLLRSRIPIAPGTYRRNLGDRARKAGAVQERRILRGIPEHHYRVGIPAAPHGNRSRTHRGTHARERDHQAPAGTALPGRAASAGRGRAGRGAFRVEKVPGDPTHTRIEPLERDERRDELERMLGGAEFLAGLRD